jgi:hypothetical protein
MWKVPKIKFVQAIAPSVERDWIVRKPDPYDSGEGEWQPSLFD